MKIGIDLDDVVFEFAKPLLNFYFEKYGKLIKFEEVNTYHFSDIFNLSLKEVICLMEEMISKDFAENQSVCDYAEESILNLANNHEIIFITSRLFREGTLESLKKLFSNINFKLIYTSNSYAGTGGKTKGDICCNENIDVMIEDSKEYAHEIASRGKKVFLLDKPWNKDYKIHQNIIKLDCWKDIGEHMKK